jgi:S1-C subfamily serine protease
VNQFNRPFTVPAGVGSGVIYDDQGHILTNNHVIEGAESLLVSLPDGRSFPAELVGADPQTDLAVLQITGDNLTIANWGILARRRWAIGWSPSATPSGCPGGRQ